MILDQDTLRSNLVKYTTLAFSLLPRMNKPTILDAGCGTGVPTIRLAELSDGMILALDKDRTALKELARKLVQKQLLNRITLVNCLIENMPFDKEVFDVVWAEGSISHLGFKRARDELAKHLKSGGFLVMHDDAEHYPEKISAAGSTGFSLLGFFLLSESVWWEEYYKHLEAALASTDSVSPPHELIALRKELDEFKSEPNRFRSAFFVMKKI